MDLLQLKKIHKSYKLGDNQQVQVLKDINVSFNRGELVSIIGESGSGKSTMMNVIGGLDSQFEGELLIEGKNIGNFSQKELDEYRKNRIGFVFQSCNLIPHLSILDNVTIALTLSNLDKEERVKRAVAALTEVGLEQHVYKKPNQLSGGQKQRVAIARALINDPEIILADEPTGALDSETTEQVLSIIKNIARKGKLVIMVTHSERVAAHSSRVVQIADGEIIRDSVGVPLDNVVVEEITSHKGEQNLSFLSAAKLAANNMKQKFKRNLLVAIGVSIGIMSVVVMLSLGSGIKSYFTDTLNGFMNPLVVEVSMPIVAKDKHDEAMKMMMGDKIPFEDKNKEELSKIEGVKSVEDGFSYTAMGTNSLHIGGEKADIAYLSSMSSTITKDNIEKGTKPGKNEILINKGIADHFKEDIIGKEVELTAFVDGQVVKGTFKVSGIYKPMSKNPMADQQGIVFVNYNDFKDLLAVSKMTLKPTLVFLVTEDENVASTIKTTVSDLGYGGSQQEAMGDQVLTMLNMMTLVFAGIASISLVVSAFMILVVLNISVVERTKEIGLLRAIGARSKDIKRIFVSEAFLLGISSGVIGVIVAFVISLGVNAISVKQFDVAIMDVTAYYIVAGLVASTFISMLAGLIPARKAAKLDPVDSLRVE